MSPRSGLGSMALGVLAVVAMVTPLGAAAADTSTRSSGGHSAAAPTYVIQPGALKRGEDPAILWLDGTTIVDGDRRINAGPDAISLIGKTGTDYLIGTVEKDTGNISVWRLSESGSRIHLLRGYDAASARVDSAGTRLVAAKPARGKTVLALVDLATNRVTTRSVAGSVTILDSTRDVAWLSRWNRPATLSWGLDEGTIAQISDRTTYRGDIENGLLAEFTQDPYQGGCTELMSVTGDAPRLMWRSCTERVEGFSPDGRRLVTVDILTDGIGPGRTWVRTSRGRLLATLLSYGWFGRLEFESAHDLLLSAHGSKKSAVVRCDPQGCERASALTRTQVP